MNELKPVSVHDCWKNLESEDMNDFKGFPGVDGEVKKILHTAREVSGCGLATLFDE